MDTKQFLTAVLHDDGYYCAVGIKNKVISHKWRDSIDELIEAAKEFDAEGQDTFFGLGAYCENRTKKEDGQHFRRKAYNVTHLKSFFLDIDCGEEKPFPDQKSGLTALGEFTNKFNLPYPTHVVSSGRGIHAYWVLDRGYPRSEWKGVADRFKRACMEGGFPIDPNVPADAARVLRVPNTHNYKDNRPRTVKVLFASDNSIRLEDFADRLPEYGIKRDPNLVATEFSEYDKADMEAAINNRTYKFTTLLRKLANGTGCNQMKRALDTPNELTYDQWLHVLSILKFCEEGDQAVHAVSSKYEGYSEEETTKVSACIERPHLCVTFERDYPQGCEGCPHKNTRMRTPITLCGELKVVAEGETTTVEVIENAESSNKNAESSDQNAESSDQNAESSNKNAESSDQNAESNETPVDEEQDSVLVRPKTKSYKIPPYPRPFARGEGGGVYLLTKDKDGEPEDILVHDNDLYMVSRLRDPIEGPCYLVRHHTKREGVHDFVTSSVTLSSPEEFRKEMCKNDIFVRAKNSERLMSYMEKWIRELQKTQDEIHVRTQFGWTEDNKSFVVGDREICARKIKPNPPGARTAQYFPYFKKKGTLEGWKKIPQYYDREGFEPHQYMFGLSFGSPLMRFVPGIHGATYNLTSADTGYGKTTGQLGGASVWGDPAKVVLKGQDTHHSLFLRAEVYKNIVLYVDEMSNLDGRQASEFCYGVSNGEQRNRLSNSGQNIERYRGETWDMSVGASGNSSITEIASRHRKSPKGELGRVINQEATLLLTGDDDVKRGRELAKLLEQHYGHAAEVYMQHIIQNLDDVKDRVEKAIDKLNKDAGLTPQHRFWCGQAATTYVGTLEAKSLGLIDWDINNLYWWIVARLKEKKEELIELDLSISEILRQYYAENVNRFLRVKSTTSGVQVEDLENVYQAPDAMPVQHWVGRHEYDKNMLYLLPGPLKVWCLQQNFHWNSIRSRILTEMGGRPKNVRLGSGTKIDIGTMYTLAVRLSDLECEESSL